MKNDFQKLACPDLTVIPRDDDDDIDHQVFFDALATRSFSEKGLGDQSKWPSAIFQARSVTAVQQVIQFCRKHFIKVCVRSGGHCWHTSWLQGSESVLLDVGDLNDVEFNEQDRSLSVGPGAKGLQVLEQLPESMFFPCGHCPSVSLGGFILGTGFGIGFNRYSMTSMLVNSVQVVLGTGEIVNASDQSTDPRERAIMDLLRGSHCCFPGVITKFNFANLPTRPGFVLEGSLVYDMVNYRSAIHTALNVQFKKGHDHVASKVETTLIFKAPKGSKAIVVVALMIWADTENEARQLWDTCTKNTSNTLAPIEEPKPRLPEKVPPSLGCSYPANHQYEVCAHMATPTIQQWSFDEVADMVEPIAEMWKGPDCPPPPSHTLFVPINSETQKKCHGDKQFVYGFTPALTVMTYAIYKDATVSYRESLEKAHAKMAQNPEFYVEFPEGNVLKDGPKSGFMEDSFKEATAKAKLLDPHGLFYGMENRRQK